MELAKNQMITLEYCDSRTGIAGKALVKREYSGCVKVALFPNPAGAIVPQTWESVMRTYEVRTYASIDWWKEHGVDFAADPMKGCVHNTVWDRRPRRKYAECSYIGNLSDIEQYIFLGVDWEPTPLRKAI
jgi:hypothetical protein